MNTLIERIPALLQLSELIIAVMHVILCVLYLIVPALLHLSELIIAVV